MKANDLTYTQKMAISDARTASRVAQLTPRQAQALDNTPKMFRRRYAQVMTGECSAQVAVKMKCTECVGFEEVTNRIHTCTVMTCPLWNFRPHQGRVVAGGGDDGSEATTEEAGESTEDTKA